MRCTLLLAGVLVSATSTEDIRASSGVVLLQRPSHILTHVELDDHGERPILPETSALTGLPEFPVHHFSGALARLKELGLQPLLEHEALGVLVSGEWRRWTPHHLHHHHHHPPGIHGFLSSVVFFDWCLFASAILVFLILHMLVLGRLAEYGYHISVLMIWLCVGAVYNSVIWLRFGSDAGISWFAGYLLEFIFLVENIFIFHIVVQAFKTPVELTTKALHIVVWGQIMFEMIFFMGLAEWLRSFKVLPYLLGVWLICCGFLAAHGEPSFDGEIMETSACRAFTSCLGERLSPKYEKDGECLLRDKSGKVKVSLLGLVVLVLLLVDFLLEIDVVLTKIEELPNPYIAFTSSAVAAFSIPNLFFVSQGLLKKFSMLKYGIGFVLVLFGAQMLLSSIYILRPIVACCIIVGVLIACVLTSLCMDFAKGKGPGAGNALTEVGQRNEGDASVATKAGTSAKDGNDGTATGSTCDGTESPSSKRECKLSAS